MKNYSKITENKDILTKEYADSTYANKSSVNNGTLTIRKESGLEVTDRINTTIYADGSSYEEIGDALSEYSEYVAAQTLSVSLELKKLSEMPEGAVSIEWGDSTICIKVSKR